MNRLGELKSITTLVVLVNGRREGRRYLSGGIDQELDRWVSHSCERETVSDFQTLKDAFTQDC